MSSYKTTAERKSNQKGGLHIPAAVITIAHMQVFIASVFVDDVAHGDFRWLTVTNAEGAPSGQGLYGGAQSRRYSRNPVLLGGCGEGVRRAQREGRALYYGANRRRPLHHRRIR